LVFDFLRDHQEWQIDKSRNGAQAIETFKQRVVLCPNPPGEVDNFIQQIEQKASATDRATMGRQVTGTV